MSQARGLKFFFPIFIMGMTLACNLAGRGWLWFPTAFMLSVGVGREWLGRQNLATPSYRWPLLLDLALAASTLALFCVWLSLLWLVGPVHAYERHLPAAWVAAKAASSALELGGSVTSLGILFGAIGFVVGHELIHRTGSGFATGVARVLLAFAGSPAFGVEHVHGHHLNVGTGEDPTTARRGESIYAFFFRSVWGQFRSAWHIEARRLRTRRSSLYGPANRLLQGYVMLACFVAVSASLGGARGVVAYGLVLVIGRYYLEVSNYVQHYGLVRVPGTTVQSRHAWDQYAGSTNMLTFNMPRHADHHLYGDKPFFRLEPKLETLTLPIGYKTAALVVLLPPLWQRMMRPMIAKWDRELASSGELGLLSEG